MSVCVCVCVCDGVLCLCSDAYLMGCFVEEFFMGFNTTYLSVIISLCMFIESIFKSKQKTE